MSEPALVFTHHGLTLAVPARLGREAFTTGQVMPLPGGHAALLGLTEVRGRAVPLLNMSSLTAQEAPAHPPAAVPASRGERHVSGPPITDCP